MAKPQLVTDDALKVLKALVKAKVPFMIVGNTAAILQGANVATIDIDLWFGKGGLEKAGEVLKPLGIAIVSGFGMAQIPPQFTGPGVETLDIVTTAEGLGSFEKELKSARQLKVGTIVVNVLRLDRVIKSKKAANRDKDKAVLQQLETVWKVVSRKQ